MVPIPEISASVTEAHNRTGPYSEGMPPLLKKQGKFRVKFRLQGPQEDAM